MADAHARALQVLESGRPARSYDTRRGVDVAFSLWGPSLNFTDVSLRRHAFLLVMVTQ